MTPITDPGHREDARRCRRSAASLPVAAVDARSSRAHDADARAARPAASMPGRRRSFRISARIRRVMPGPPVGWSCPGTGPRASRRDRRDALDLDAVGRAGGRSSAVTISRSAGASGDERHADAAVVLRPRGRRRDRGEQPGGAHAFGAATTSICARRRRSARRSCPARRRGRCRRSPRRRRSSRPRRAGARRAARCGPRRRGCGSGRGTRGCRRGRARSPARRGSAARGRRAGSGRRRAAGACRASSCRPCRRPRRPRPTRSSAPSTRPCALLSRAAAWTCRFSRPVRWRWKRGSSMIAPTRASASARVRSLAEQPDRPAGRVGEAEKQPDQRGLAGAIGPEEAERAAAWDLEIDALERDAFTEALAERGGVDGQVGHETKLRSPRRSDLGRAVELGGRLIPLDETAARPCRSGTAQPVRSTCSDSSTSTSSSPPSSLTVTGESPPRSDVGDGGAGRAGARRQRLAHAALEDAGADASARRARARTTRSCGWGTASACSICGPIGVQVELIERGEVLDADRALRVADRDVLERGSPRDLAGAVRRAAGIVLGRQLRAAHVDAAGRRRR